MNMLDNCHRTDRDYRQRMDRREWRFILLTSEDSVIFKGNVIKLVADDIGYGVVEVHKDFKVPDSDDNDKT